MEAEDAKAGEVLSEIWSEMTRVRKLRNMTQDALAVAAGITQGAISRIENGTLLPSADNQENLAKALDFPDADTFFTLLAKIALVPKTLTDLDFGEDAFTESQFKQFQLWKERQEQNDNHRPEVFDELMKLREAVRESDDDNIVDVAASSETKVTTRASAEVVKDMKRETDHHVLKADTGVFIAQGQDVQTKLNLGIGSLRPKRGKSLLFNTAEDFDENGKLRDRPPSQKPHTMPRYHRDAPRDFPLWGALSWGGTDDYTAIPPMLANTTGPYAVQLNTNHMAPRYSQGDIVYVNPQAVPYYGDDVSVLLKQDNNIYAYVTRIVKMTILTDKQGNEWTAYGCLGLADEQELYEDAIFRSASQSEFEEDRDGTIDWFLLRRKTTVADLKREMTEYPDGLGDVNHLIAHDMHVVVGCERKRISDNFARPNPRSKRRLEARFEAETILTPMLPENLAPDHWVEDELERDFHNGN